MPQRRTTDGGVRAILMGYPSWQAFSVRERSPWRMDRVGSDLAGWRLAALCLCLAALAAIDPERRKSLMEHAEGIAELRIWTRQGWLVAAERDPRSPGCAGRRSDRDSRSKGKSRDVRSVIFNQTK
jgi:hypothetical protein